MSYKTHRDIIDAWPSFEGRLPGLSSFAADHGVKYDTAKGWRRRNSIPPERWLKTISLAELRGLSDVTHQTLQAMRPVGRFQTLDAQAAA